MSLFYIFFSFYHLPFDLNEEYYIFKDFIIERVLVKTTCLASLLRSIQIKLVIKYCSFMGHTESNIFLLEKYCNK